MCSLFYWKKKGVPFMCPCLKFSHSHKATTLTWQEDGIWWCGFRWFLGNTFQIQYVHIFASLNIWHFSVRFSDSTSEIQLQLSSQKHEPRLHVRCRNGNVPPPSADYFANLAGTDRPVVSGWNLLAKFFLSKCLPTCIEHIYWPSI